MHRRVSNCNCFCTEGIDCGAWLRVLNAFSDIPLFILVEIISFEDDHIYKIVIPYLDFETGKENILIPSPVQELLLVLGEEEMSVKDMMKMLNLKGSDHFRKSYLHPALSAHLVEMTHPENPKHRNQKYRVCK